MKAGYIDSILMLRVLCESLAWCTLQLIDRQIPFLSHCSSNGHASDYARDVHPAAIVLLSSLFSQIQQYNDDEINHTKQ